MSDTPKLWAEWEPPDEPPPAEDWTMAPQALHAMPEGHDAVTAAERALLGSLLLGARDVAQVAAIVSGRDFHHPRHELVWEACLALDEQRVRLDPVAVAGAIEPRELERIGGHVWLAGLIGAGVTSGPTFAVRYAEQVAQHALRRRLRNIGPEIVDILATRTDAVQAAEDVRQAVDAAAGTLRTAEAAVLVGDFVDETIDWLERKPVGAKTPWPDVNDATNGLLAGQLIVVGARPGNGKSMIAKDVAVHTAQTGRAVHIATLEMGRNEYTSRILAGLGSVDLTHVMRRETSDNEWERLAKARGQLTGLPLFIDQRESQTMAQIRAAARNTARRHGDLGLIVIDYIQLVQPADTRVPRQEQVAAMSRAAKLMAKEFDCPLMLLAQLNRGSTSRSDHTPVVSDLRESGSLEQDADQVWLLHRPGLYADGEDRLGEVDLIIGKNRNGSAPQTVPLAFQGHYGRIASLAR